MSPLPVTSTAAGVLGLIYLVLAARVVANRFKSGASLGDGGTGTVPAGQEHTVPLLVACRSHANFAEYVPIALLLLGLNEVRGAPHWLMLTLAAALVAARVLHPIGMGRKVPNAFRGGGTILTFTVVGVASLALLVR